jgi:hypothetical protein
MVEFKTVLNKFNKKGEKTGWTFIDIPADVAIQLNGKSRKSFRVRGVIDNCKITQTALLPMGDGTYILPVNAGMRKAIRKKEGAVVALRLEKDESEIVLDSDLLSCLEDEPEAKTFFDQLSNSHRNYYSKWIASSKTVETKTKRLSHCIEALLRKQHYGEMIRSLKEKKK